MTLTGDKIKVYYFNKQRYSRDYQEGEASEQTQENSSSMFVSAVLYTEYLKIK